MRIETHCIDQRSDSADSTISFQPPFFLVAGATMEVNEKTGEQKRSECSRAVPHGDCEIAPPPRPSLFHCTSLRFAAPPDSPSRLADYSKPLRDDDAAGGGAQASPSPRQGRRQARRGGSGAAWRIMLRKTAAENRRNSRKIVKLKLSTSVSLGFFDKFSPQATSYEYLCSPQCPLFTALSWYGTRGLLECDERVAHAQVARPDCASMSLYDKVRCSLHPT